MFKETFDQKVNLHEWNLTTFCEGRQSHLVNSKGFDFTNSFIIFILTSWIYYFISFILPTISLPFQRYSTFGMEMCFTSKSFPLNCRVIKYEIFIKSTLPLLFVPSQQRSDLAERTGLALKWTDRIENDKKLFLSNCVLVSQTALFVAMWGISADWAMDKLWRSDLGVLWR